MTSQFPDSDRASVRERILEVALRHFAEHGGRASLRRIASDADTSLGALQHYFPTKANLAKAVEEYATRPFYERQGPTFEIVDMDFPAFLRTGLLTYLSFTREHPDVVALGTRLATERPDHQWPGEAETNAELIRRIRVAQDGATLKDFDPRWFVVLLEALLNSWSSHRDHLMRHLPEVADEDADEQFVRFAADLVLNGARPRDPEP
ncbi:MAG: TetR/AcrR family transcriptional regulator [Myxococcota bacterium]